MVGELKMSGKELSTARIGKIGELAVMKDILNQGYHCYSPACDDAQVDLVIETSYSFKRIQVKTISKLKKGTSIEVRMHKHRYKERVDILAIYFMPKDIIAYYPYNNELSVSLALKVAGNNQEKGRDWFYKYELIPQITKE
jgi:hypothetical protein